MSAGFVTRTEQLVHDVCERSCLSLWCYPNPRAKPGKELCDILVVCDLYVLIVSVKEVAFKPEEASVEHHVRWQRRAVEASVKQLYGAQRWLEAASRAMRGLTALRGCPYRRLGGGRSFGSLWRSGARGRFPSHLVTSARGSFT